LIAESILARNLQTWGDYAAIKVYETDGVTHHIVIARLSTKETWRLPARPGKAFTEVLAVSPDEVWLGENDGAAGGPDEGFVARRLLRVRIDAAAEIAKAGW